MLRTDKLPALRDQPASEAVATKPTNRIRRELANKFKQLPLERSAGLFLETTAPALLQARAREVSLK